MPKPARDLPVGVYHRPDMGDKYTASICRWTPTGKMQKHLGTFGTVEDALAARKRAEQEREEHHD